MKKAKTLFGNALLVIVCGLLSACADEFRWRTVGSDLCSSSVTDEVPTLGHFNSHNISAMLLDRSRQCERPFAGSAFGEKEARNVENYLEGNPSGYPTQTGMSPTGSRR